MLTEHCVLKMIPFGGSGSFVRVVPVSPTPSPNVSPTKRNNVTRGRRLSLDFSFVGLEAVSPNIGVTSPPSIRHSWESFQVKTTDVSTETLQVSNETMDSPIQVVDVTKEAVDGSNVAEDVSTEGIIGSDEVLDVSNEVNTATAETVDIFTEDVNVLGTEVDVSNEALTTADNDDESEREAEFDSDHPEDFLLPGASEASKIADAVLDSSEDYESSDSSASTNLTSLPDNTMDGSQQQSLRNVSSGRMSPVRPRTMRDYEEQIAELKKENFSLKLRIYFMEERMQHGEEEDIEKTNIELKVEVESLKKELHDKQELLVKASQAVETLAAQNDAAVQQVRQDHGRELQQLRHQYESRLTSAQEENTLQKRVDEETEGKIRDLEAANQELQNKLRDLEKVKQDKKNLQDSSKEALQDKNRVIDQLNHALRTKDQLIQQLNQDKADLVAEKVKPLEAQVQNLTQELRDKEGNMQDDINRYQQQVEVSKKNNQEIQALLEDQQRKLDEYEIAAGQMTRDHDKKEKEIKELKRKLQDKESDVKLQEQNALKRDKAIQGLTEAIHNKSKEIDELCEQIEELQQSLAQARETAHKAQLQQFQGVEEQQQALSDKEAEITGLQGKVHEKDAENQRLKKSLRKKEQEIDQLQQAAQEADDQADEALRDKDRQLRDLQKQLKDSKSRADTDRENITQQHKTQLEETQRQLQSKEQIIQRLSASIQEKDKVIQEYMQMAQEQENSRDPYSENKDSIIQRLRERLKERDKAVEDAIEEKFRTLEAKENDLRHLRVSLRERERELERANSLLAGNEETINNLDGIIKEKDVELRQLLNQLKSQQRTNAATAEEHARALLEKEAVIEQLQHALSSRDKDIKKLSQSLQSSPQSKPRVDAMIQELKDKLDERDRMLQEVMDERRRASSDGHAHTQRLLGTIKDKDNMLKEANERYNQVVSEKNGEIQKLQQRLNKREAELQSLTSARDWTEQEQNKLLEKMRAALSDKDRTIETLVDNAREKDKLLSQLQMSGPSQLRGEHLADTVRQLKDDIRKKDELIDRLQSSSTSGYVSTEDDPYVQSLRKELASKARLLSETTAALQSLRDQKPSQGDVQQQMAQQTQALNNALKAEKQAKLELAKVRRKAQEQEEDLGTKQENIDALIDAVRAKDDIIKDLERNQLSSRPALRGDQSPKAKQQLQKGLRDQLEETKKLNELLDSERRIYQDLIKSYRDELGATRDSQSRALDIELAAVQTLRRQLEDYVRRNSELRVELERNINQAAQQVLEATDSLRDRPRVQTWNAALQTSIDDLRPQFEKNIQTSPITRSTDIEISLPSPLDALSVSEFSTAELKSEVARLRGQLRRMQAINDDLQARLNGAISEQVRSIPVGENIAEQQTLPKLAKELERLEAELDNAQKENQALQEELESVKSMTPMGEKGLLAEVQQQLEDAIMQLEKSEDDKLALEKQVKLSSPSPYQAQIRQLENKVMELIEENEQLMKESPGSRSDEEVDAMSEKDLRTEVKGLKDRLKASENLVDLLKKQLEMNSDPESDTPGFNPELIVQLAEEIERLKGQLEQARGSQGEVRDREEESSDTSSQLPRKSKLPVLQKGVPHDANAALRQQIEQLKMSEKELKLLNRRLQDKLTATEGTVRAQAQKLKTYRKMLEDAGLVKKVPRKAQSDSNIPMSLQRFHSRYASQEGLDDSLLSPGVSPGTSPMTRSPATSLLSLETLQEYGNTDNVDELKQQVAQLKQRLEKSRRMIRGMQSRMRGRSDGQLTPNRSFARSMETLTEPSTNGDAFEKLRQQVEDLRQQLKESNDLNKTLADQLSVSPQKDSLVQTQAKELSQLRKQLRDSREMCHLLRARLEELTRTLEHLLSASEGGDPDLLNLTQQEAEGVMAELERSMHLARTLKDRLDDNASSASDDSSLRSLKDQYQQSLKANQELREQLQEQLRQLQDRPSPTPLKQEIAELRSALEEQQDHYQHLKQANQQLQGQVADAQHLRRQLAENQRTAVELKDELERATKDAKEKNNMISRLRSQLRRTRPVGSTFPPSASDQASTGWDSDQSNQGASDDFSGMHRVGSGRSANHGSQTTSGSEDNRGEQPLQRTYPPNGGDEYSLEQPGRSKPTSGEDNFMFAPRDKVIPPSIHSSKDDVCGHGRLHDNRGYSSDEESTTSTQTFTSVSRHESDHPEDSEQESVNRERGMYPSHQLPSKFLQASAGHGSSTTVSTETHGEMELLQSRLRASDQINRSLRAELDTYKKLRESTETIHSHGSASTPTSGFHGDSRGRDLLEEHLAELRALRARLEDSLSSNEQLRQELENKISSMSNRGGQTNIYVHSNSGVDHQEFPDSASHGSQSHMSDKLSLLSDKTTQVDRLQAELDQKHQINEKLKAEMSRLQSQLTEKDQLNQQVQEDNTRLQTDMSKLQKQLAERDRQTQKTQAEFTQLQRDLSSLQGQLQDVSQLQNQLSDREKQNQILQTEVDSLGAELANRDMENDKVSAELTKAKKEISRLRQELSRLQDQLEEHQQVADSLRLELRLYEKLYKKAQTADAGVNGFSSNDGTGGRDTMAGLDLSGLLEEMRRLREQVEKLHISNSALRRKVKELLGKEESPTVININHHHGHRSPAQRALFQSGGGDASPGDVHLSGPYTTDSAHSSPANHPRLKASPLAGHLARYASLPVLDKDDIDLFSMQGVSPLSTADIDIRYRYVVGRIEDYDALRHQVNDSRLAIRGVQSRVKDRLKALKKAIDSTQPGDQKPLEETLSSLHLLHDHLEECHRLLKLFWKARDPGSVPTSTGSGGDGSTAIVFLENQNLKDEITNLRKRLTSQEKVMRSALHKLERTNRLKQGMEEALVKQLSKTHHVLRQARGNLEVQAKHAGHEVPPSSSGTEER